ncbi:hypothetical protein BDR04DRAFT_1107071 [Suillus decipiens]|nr:hypothetical protein BDR04DRAFT_1107071 [Suillus decipiens]
MTPFVRFGLLHHAVEPASGLGVCRNPGDSKYNQGVVFLMSAMEDARVYAMDAPLEVRHRKNVLCASLEPSKGPQMPTDPQEFRACSPVGFDV